MSAPESLDAIDLALSRKIRSGAHRQALQDCVEQLALRLGRFCQTLLGDRRQANDCLAELFAAFFEAMPHLGGSSPSVFLYEKALALCAERLDTGGSHRQQALLAPLHGGGACLPESVEEARAQPERIRAALAALKAVERDVAVLRFAAGLGYDDIARITGRSRDDAIKLAGRALLGMRQQLLGAEAR